MGDNLVEASALAAAARGWRVFPLAAGTKRPAIKRWEAIASTDPAVIQGWFSRSRSNLAIACGPSDLVVVDIDAPAPGASLETVCAQAVGRRCQSTLSVATPRGVHLYYRSPPGQRLRNTAGRLAPNVDTRAWGGYVVGVGSRTAAGSYRLLRAGPPAPLPDHLADALTPLPPRLPTGAVGPSGTGARERVDAYVAAAVRNEIVAVVSAPKGTRHDTLLRAAVALGRLAAAGALDAGTVRAQLLAAAAVHDRDGFSAAEAARVVDDAFAWASTRPRRLPGRVP